MRLKAFFSKTSPIKLLPRRYRGQNKQLSLTTSGLQRQACDRWPELPDTKTNLAGGGGSGGGGCQDTFVIQPTSLLRFDHYTHAVMYIFQSLRYTLMSLFFSTFNWFDFFFLLLFSFTSSYLSSINAILQQPFSFNNTVVFLFGNGKCTFACNSNPPPIILLKSFFFFFVLFVLTCGLPVAELLPWPRWILSLFFGFVYVSPEKPKNRKD